MPRAKAFDEEEILRKAMMLFWQKGYHDTSIKDLIAYLGISNASIYNAFGGKKQLFIKAISCYQDFHFNGLKAFLESHKEVKSGLVIVFDKLIVDDHEDEACKGCFIVNTTTELIPADPEIQQILERHKEKFEQLFLDYLRAGVENGQISEKINITVIAPLLYTLMTGLRVLGKTKPNPEESRASVQAVLSLLD